MRPRRARRPREWAPDAALQQELAALLADERNLLNTLIDERQLAQAARTGQALALRWDTEAPLPVAGFARPVRVERFWLLLGGGPRELCCAVVYAGGRQSVFALDGELASRLQESAKGIR